jgi:hypothetical protein
VAGGTTSGAAPGASSAAKPPAALRLCGWLPCSFFCFQLPKIVAVQKLVLLKRARNYSIAVRLLLQTLLVKHEEHGIV